MKIKLPIFVLIVFFIGACHPAAQQNQEKKLTETTPAQSIATIVRQVSDQLPLTNTEATVFFQKLDSIVSSNTQHEKREIRYGRYTIYYDSDSTIIKSIWMELNPGHELHMSLLEDTFKSDWQPASSNKTDIKTEDGVVHKTYTYPTIKGVVDIRIYSRYEKITGLLFESRNKL